MLSAIRHNTTAFYRQLSELTNFDETLFFRNNVYFHFCSLKSGKSNVNGNVFKLNPNHLFQAVHRVFSALSSSILSEPVPETH